MGFKLPICLFEGLVNWDFILLEQPQSHWHDLALFTVDPQVLVIPLRAVRRGRHRQGLVEELSVRADAAAVVSELRLRH